MKSVRTLTLAAGVMLASVGIFVVDAFSVPLGVAIWMPYVAVVLASLWLPHRWQVYSVATWCSVLTVAALFLSPVGVEFWLGGVNRSFAVLAFWCSAAIGLRSRRTKELEASNRALKREMERREQLEAQLLRSQRLESIGVLAGGIAHDFNNLLNPILISGRLLQEDNSPEDRQRLLATLQASGERAAELVRKLLTFSGGIGSERSVVNVNDAVSAIAEIIRHTFPKTICVRTHFAPGLPTVIADSTQLSQVLMNLCVNARDAMASGGTLAILADKITLDEQQVRSCVGARPGDFVRLTVEDTGSGISPEVLDHAFEPFFTTKPPEHGTGLGLSTTLGIVRSHGGFMRVETTEGIGSRFMIHLPAQFSERAAQGVPRQSVGQHGNGQFILVVDDDEPTLVATTTLLDRHGYRVLTAQGGNEALEIHARDSTEIRAALVDMTMPDMDGVSVIAHLRRRDPQLPIIAGSGRQLTGPVAESLAANKVPFLPKPYSEENLLAVLREVLDVR